MGSGHPRLQTVRLQDGDGFRQNHRHGYVAAWSILNKVNDRSDARFSDVELIVCPNVTIRDRLAELNPENGEASLYRTRNLVPSHLMDSLRRGRVLVTNWHVFERRSPPQPRTHLPYDVTTKYQGMTDILFEWDDREAQPNENKHGISFEEAQTAFYDENARRIPDPDHSQDQDRYGLLGLSAVLRVLIVCHVYRQDDEVIRLISARKATKREQQQYPRFVP